MKALIFMIVLCHSAVLQAGGGTWNELGDAPSFPDGQPQITQGAGELNLIVGNTSPVSDPRNAYCIKITDPANFYVTANNAIDNTANTDFDTSLYLFDKRGKPLLFNDDTPPSSASTLTSVTTDGSGFTLTQPGEYILVVAGFSDKPLDNIANNLFVDGNITVNSANQNAGRFQTWENNSPATGAYTLAVQGAEFCQDQLDVIGTNLSASDSSMCFGDDQGDFKSCNDNSSSSGKDDIATGYFNKDKYLDVMFDQSGDSPTLCLGSDSDGFNNCRNLDIGVTNTSNVAMADVNNDGHLDAAFIYAIGQVSDVVKVCMGNGNNGFNTACSDVTVDLAFHSNLDFAYMDGDKNIDMIVHGFNAIRICLGDGQGNFSSCNIVNVPSGIGLALADVNNDNHLDIVTNGFGLPSQVCTNNGNAELSCSAMNGFDNFTTGVSMADLDGDGNVDAVFSNSSGLNQVCMGDGLAGFSCNNVSGVAENHLSIDLGDLNGDNILDVVFGAVTFSRICYGVGNGTFTGCHNDNKMALNQVKLGEFRGFSQWLEIADAPSFPDGQAQITRGQGELPFISGSTNFGNGDSRDAYCVKVTDPSSFYATTNNSVDNNATTNFDTRLYLFDKKGKPLLFNDDGSPPSLASTLTDVTTDGSGFTLTQGGEYILIIAGFFDDPKDSMGNVLFEQTPILLHAPIPNSNHFSTWDNDSPQTGDYFIALQGVSYCQDKLDIVGTGSALTNNSQLCSGDGNGGFDSCHNDSLNSGKSAISTGYLDNDEHLDVIFDTFIGDIPSICLGDGVGGYRDCVVFGGTGTNNTEEAIFGDINNDNLTDVVFIANGENHKVCLGNGLGNFTGCSDITNSAFVSSGAQLAFMDADSNLDFIFSDFDGLNICLGDGMGSFAACSRIVIDISHIQAVDVNKDGNTDIIGAFVGSTNKVCINNGAAGLTCNVINAETNRTTGLSTGDLNNDGNIDVVFTNLEGAAPGMNKVCLGDGNGAFNCNNISGVAGDYLTVKLGLLNDDNFLDVVFAGSTFTRICMGNGDGTFSNCANDNNLKFFDIELGEFGHPLPDMMFADGFE